MNDKFITISSLKWLQNDVIGIKYRCFCDDSINIKVMGGKIPLYGAEI